MVNQVLLDLSPLNIRWRQLFLAQLKLLWCLQDLEIIFIFQINQRRDGTNFPRWLSIPSWKPFKPSMNSNMCAFYKQWIAWALRMSHVPDQFSSECGSLFFTFLPSGLYRLISLMRIFNFITSFTTFVIFFSLIFPHLFFHPFTSPRGLWIISDLLLFCVMKRLIFTSHL